MKTKQHITHVPDSKKKIVKELGNLIQNKKTVLIASIKNIPASQFQEIVKKLRGKAIVKVPKKNLLIRALDESKEEAVKKIEDQVKDSVAILFSDMDCFDLAAELIKNKTPAKARAGQEAPDNIEVPAGPTDLVPGPAISELGALGIQIQIDKGKINIKEPKIVAKKGEKISSGAADILSKLDIKPFSISFIPLACYDANEKKIFLDIKIDTEEVVRDLKQALVKALAFATDLGYTNKDTIKFILLKAYTNAKALEKFENTPEINSGEEK